MLIVSWVTEPFPLHLLTFRSTVASMSHVSPAFAPVFGNCIKLLRKVLYTTDGQPFLVAGSGTLGWDAVAANLIEKDEKAVSTIDVRPSCMLIADTRSRF
jgi:aspartate aminotransferase-like enzyme